MIIWRPLVGECLQSVKKPTNEVCKNAVAVVRSNSYCREEVVGHVQQISPWLYPCFYACPIALWTSLQLGNASTMEVNTDWKPLQIFIFMDLKRPLNLIKNNKDQRKLKRNCKTLSKVKCIQISCKKCVVWLVIWRVHYREVSSTW